jgi:hypothetical protein
MRVKLQEVEDFWRCRRFYYYRWIKKLNRPPTAWYVFQDAVHKAFVACVRRQIRKRGKWTPEEMLAHALEEYRRQEYRIGRPASEKWMLRMASNAQLACHEYLRRDYDLIAPVKAGHKVELHLPCEEVPGKVLIVENSADVIEKGGIGLFKISWAPVPKRKSVNAVGAIYTAIAAEKEAFWQLNYALKYGTAVRKAISYVDERIVPWFKYALVETAKSMRTMNAYVPIVPNFHNCSRNRCSYWYDCRGQHQITRRGLKRQ